MRVQLVPILGRPLTEVYDDAFDGSVEDLVERHVATRPWERVERILTGSVSREDVVEMCVALNCSPLLSSFLVQAATTMPMGEHATHEYCGYLLTRRQPDDEVQDVMSGEGPPAPSKVRLIHGQSIANKTLKLGRTTGAYTARAWMYWAMGATSTAKKYAEKALQLNAENALARQVFTMGHYGVGPTWSRRA